MTQQLLRKLCITPGLIKLLWLLEMLGSLVMWPPYLNLVTGPVIETLQMHRKFTLTSSWHWLNFHSDRIGISIHRSTQVTSLEINSVYAVVCWLIILQYHLNLYLNRWLFDWHNVWFHFKGGTVEQYWNLYPQNGHLNRGLWSSLESGVRRIAVRSNSYFVVAEYYLEYDIFDLIPTYVHFSFRFF